MDDAKRAFYQYHSSPDGAVGRPGLDRVHRRQADRRHARSQRPASFALLRDEGRPGHHGVRSRRARHSRRQTSLQKGRLQPGRMFLVDTEQGRIIDDEEIKRAIANERPYRQWLNDHQVHLNDLPAAPRGAGAGSRHAAAASDRVRLHVRRRAPDPRADGAERRRSRRLDGQRHAARGAVEQAAPAVRLFQAAVRAGHEPADRLHPRGDHHLRRNAPRLGRQSARIRSRPTAAASK